jgi:hypothetical protein
VGAYELAADVDIRQLIHTQQHRRFLEQAGLELVRPGARSRPARGLSRMSWYDDVYLPAVAALHRAELPADYAYGGSLAGPS